MKPQGRFRSNWLKPAQYIFFVFYVISLVAVTGLIQKKFSHPPQNIAVDPKIKNMEIKMTVLEQNDPYSFRAALDAEGRILTVKKIEAPELMPRLLFPDEDLFFLSLEGRRLQDLPEGGNDMGFKARFLRELRRNMEIHESDKANE